MITKNNNSLGYHKKAAANLMSQPFPSVETRATLSDVSKVLYEKAKEAESVDYIYVLDKKQSLKGVISIKDLFKFPSSVKVKEIMKKELITVRPHTSQERVALLAIKHDLKVMPVVDAENKLLGVISANSILDILHRESIEDDLLEAGITRPDDLAQEIIKAPALVQIKKRLPWLVVGLLGGFLAAFVVDHFESALSLHLILAAFIPLIVYMADAVGGQSQTLYIRSVALDHTISLKSYLKKEIKVGAAVALILGLLIALMTQIWTKSFIISFVLGISIFLTIVIAILTAVLMPWLFIRRGFDPAVASGPFATVVRDLMSLIVYFSVAQIIISAF